MNILITGAEGCVGSRLKEVFEENGYVVTAFEGDVRLWSDWAKYSEPSGSSNRTILRPEWDGLIHLAAIAGVRRSFDEPEFYYDNNVNGTRNALNFADQFCNKHMYASSSNAYEWWGNPYAATKKMCEVMAVDYPQSKGMRFHTVWPGREDMLYRKLQKGEVTYINNNHWRDWIHREDLCNAILTIYQNWDKVDKKVLDIGTGKTFRVAEMAKTIFGFDGEFRDENPKGERVKTQADVEYLYNLGWKPTKDILDESMHTK